MVGGLSIVLPSYGPKPIQINRRVVIKQQNLKRRNNKYKNTTMIIMLYLRPMLINVSIIAMIKIIIAKKIKHNLKASNKKETISKTR